MKRLAFLMLAIAASAAIVSGPPMPPKLKPRLQSPRAAQQHFVAAAVAPVTRTWHLVWDYETPVPNTNIAFDVEAAPTPLGPWSKLATVDAPPFPLTLEPGRQFYRVGAHWATNAPAM